MRTPEPFTLMDIPIANVSMSEALDMIGMLVSPEDSDERAVSSTPSHPCELHFVNAHCINVAAEHAEYHEILKSCHTVFADGSGIRKAARMFGVELADNVNGTDMFPLLCEHLAARGKTLFLLGAAPGIAAKAGEWAQTHTGQPVVAGTHHGFFKEEEVDSILDTINGSGATVLLVAMGVPGQELWIRRFLDRLRIPVAMGVGGLFDFYSGNIPRAPVIMRRLGIEWVWRLLMEPRRMWRRYIIGNVTFMVRMRRLRREAQR